MDDFLVLTRTRWHLRLAVKRRHGYFKQGGDKAQLGRIAKGVDWLGVWFTPEQVPIAPRALANHRARREVLYAWGHATGLTKAATEEKVQAYETRWSLWAEGGAKGIPNIGVPLNSKEPCG